MRPLTLCVVLVSAPVSCALNPFTDIKDPSLETRADSAAALGALTDPEQVREAGRLLRDAWRTETTVLGRTAILRALARLGDPEADALAGQGLADPDGEVRAASAAAIASLGVTARRPALRQLLRDPETVVRAAAARALGALHDADPADTESVPELIARLDDEPEVAVAAHAALQALTLQPLARDGAAWRAWWEGFARAGG